MIAAYYAGELQPWHPARREPLDPRKHVVLDWQVWIQEGAEAVVVVHGQERKNQSCPWGTPCRCRVDLPENLEQESAPASQMTVKNAVPAKMTDVVAAVIPR